MSPEVDAILEAAENALTEEACSDDLQTRRTIIENALRQAKRLEEIAPDYFNTFHVQGVLWYHHPDKTSERSRQAKHYLMEALRLIRNRSSLFTISGAYILTRAISLARWGISHKRIASIGKQRTSGGAG